MRWFVEVSTIGDSAAPDRMCVEAVQWQAALEMARRLLKDDSPLAKFSIEVTEDGYRAANPALRTRYVVRRATPNATLTDETYVRPSSLPPPLPVAFAAPASASTSPSSLTVPTDAVPPAPEPPSRQQSGVRRSPPEHEQRDDLGLPPELPPSPASSEPSRELRRRVEAATAESPLLYFEVAYAVEPGLSREAVERVLLERFREICAELEAQAVRKYVQIAVFDHDFETRPLRQPLATLAWKDWRGVPAVGFPAFGVASPPLSTPPPPSPGSGSSSEPPSMPLQSRPGGSIPPSSDSVRVSPSIPVGPPELPKPPPLPRT